MGLYNKVQTISEVTLTQTIPVSEQDAIGLEILEHDHYINVLIKNKIIIGRRDPLSITQPDIDLSTFAGYRQGVSRQHAQIYRNADGYLEIVDLGSSNGTFINDKALAPNVACLLHNGDKITLGKIDMIVRYPVIMQSGK